MFSNPKSMRVALVLNLLGTAALFYSFQATSSNFRLVTTKNEIMFGKQEQSALCVYGRALITEYSDGSGSMFGPCPDIKNSRAAAVVNIEHPSLEGGGFLLLVAGFLLQLFSVPKPETIASIRTQLKALKAKEKLKRNSQ